MSKKINWDSFQVVKKASLPKGQYSSYKEMIASKTAQSQDNSEKQLDAKQLEPLLKKSLLEHLIQRKTIKVLSPIKYHCEVLVKGEESASYKFDQAEIYQGTELEFVKMDKTMGTWIFKAMCPVNGCSEIEIFSSPQISLPSYGGQQAVVNTGFYGLLYNTSIRGSVNE
jgi:hypothetical protein